MKRLFSQVSADFFRDMDVRDSSKDLYRRVLRQFSNWVVNARKDIRSLRRSDIIEYKSYLLRSSRSENTIDSYLTVVRKFYDYAERVGEHENIAAGIKVSHKRIGYRKEHLTMDEVRRLLSSIERETIIGMRDYAMVYLMLKSGLRCVELSRMRIEDIRMRQDEYSVIVQRKGDNSKNERLGMTESALRPVMDYLDFRGVASEEEPVFTTHCSTGEYGLTAKRISQIIHDRLKDAGVYSKTKTTHSLRHTFAVMAIMNKVPVKEVQLALGHRRIETTEIYLRSIDDTLRLSNPAIHVLDDIF